MTTYLPPLAALACFLAAYAVLWMRGHYATMRDERDWALLQLSVTQGRLHQYRETERTRRQNLAKWGRKGADKTNAKRVAK